MKKIKIKIAINNNIIEIKKCRKKVMYQNYTVSEAVTDFLKRVGL